LFPWRAIVARRTRYRRRKVAFLKRGTSSVDGENAIVSTKRGYVPRKSDFVVGSTTFRHPRTSSGFAFPSSGSRQMSLLKPSTTSMPRETRFLMARTSTMEPETSSIGRWTELFLRWTDFFCRGTRFSRAWTRFLEPWTSSRSPERAILWGREEISGRRTTAGKSGTAFQWPSTESKGAEMEIKSRQTQFRCPRALSSQ
jgi:hypothetical protein